MFYEISNVKTQQHENANKGQSLNAFETEIQIRVYLYHTNCVELVLTSVEKRL